MIISFISSLNFSGSFIIHFVFLFFPFTKQTLSFVFFNAKNIRKIISKSIIFAKNLCRWFFLLTKSSKNCRWYGRIVQRTIQKRRLTLLLPFQRLTVSLGLMRGEINAMHRRCILTNEEKAFRAYANGAEKRFYGAINFSSNVSGSFNRNGKRRLHR